jgi:hypothetical protein
LQHPPFFFLSSNFLDSIESIVLGVAQPANAYACRATESKALAVRSVLGKSFQSPALGDSHPEDAVPDVRRPDARSRQYRRCAGVSFFFQVIEYQVEPSVLNRRLNLFSKDCWRAALADEPEPIGPEVPGVLDAPVPPGIGEGLAGARAGPDRHMVWPACEAEGIRPAANSREEVAL